ncbi:2-hydroxyacid dehydrogenase [Faecalicatena orotica]|uniref:2-hydroxyacid dehydrogenase n=1 Tax=Faecalicatena orotica TaxID=1544 RepID=UPI00321686C4
MKVLVVDRFSELADEFQAFCKKSDLKIFRDLEIDYAKDTNIFRMQTFEEYVQKMEDEGPEWTTPDEEVLNKIKDADVLLIQWGAISSKVIDAAENLKVIVTIRSGYENINIEYAKNRGIKVSFAPSRLAEVVADMTVALALSECRGIVRRNLIATKGEWVEEKYNDASHAAISNLVVGIVGYGGIARTVAKRFTKGFGSRVIAYEKITSPSILKEDSVEQVELPELLKTADIITMHARLCPETKHMIGADEFAMMKKNAIFINTARAGLVDERALIRALDSGQIRGAGLDVYEKEPLPYDSPLLKMDNVTLMPHSAGITNDILKNSLKIIVTEIERFLNGEPLKFQV